jgi:hypothetical protein
MQKYSKKINWRFGLGLIFIGTGTGLNDLLAAWGWVSVALGIVLLIWDRIDLFKYMDESMKQLIQEKERDQNEKVIRILSRYRHDWMNDFQILIGNLRLKKYDVIEGFIQKVIQKARDESKIIRLDDVPLAIYLLGFNALHTEMNLSVDIKDTVKWNPSSTSKEFIHHTIKQMVESYRRHAVHNEFEHNVLHLEISIDDHEIHLSFTYQGRLDEAGWRAEFNDLHQELRHDGIRNNNSFDFTPSETIVHFPYAVTVK